ncbi:hypothetical protein [Rhodoferax ferrireducens]|uniref:hypothetical protein n=1 Tax=Rhodoferax ferrireducens TaxID=192843 RepID=UPI000E0CE23A|nr:hypothetical protein [Rhodoferax ferrireducens]
MNNNAANGDARVAVLVDYDNTTPEILEYTLRVVAQFGRVVVRLACGRCVCPLMYWSIHARR